MSQDLELKIYEDGKNFNIRDIAINSCYVRHRNAGGIAIDNCYVRYRNTGG